MVPDSEGIHEIANTRNPNRKADIVFVHGLGGTSHSTWRHGKEGNPDYFFWPAELGNDLIDCGIWTLGYPAGFTGLGKQGMIIEKRAGNISDSLANAGLGDRPIVFIVHSMGGLIIKHLIVDSHMLPGEDRKRIVDCTSGVIFCGTPHKGSGFADAARVFGILGGGSQEHVEEMRANTEKLDLLHDKFIEWHRQHQVSIDSYAENRKLSLTRWLFFATDYGVVVPRASANPGIAGCEIHDSDDDHLTLVKPRDRQHNVYAGVLRFIHKTLASTAQLSAQTPISGHTSAKSYRTSISISRIDKYAPAELIGREAELAILNNAWAKTQTHKPKRPHILTFVALGGEGKTSLVAKWAAELAYQDWPGCDAVFAWSFYSQGSREQNAVSSDLFLTEALTFFGDAAMACSAASGFDKGRRLAQLVGEQRALLILDGLEPLQYAPTSPMPGELKDQGLAALLKGLAAASHGLCVVTTRYSISDLRAFFGNTAQEEKLTRLSTDAGVVLLQSFGVKGSLRKTIPNADGQTLWNEFEKLVEDVKGHALTLNLLGSYLCDGHGGDIRRRDLIKLEEADAEEQGGHAFRVMDAYVQSLTSGGKSAEDQAKGRRALALLQLLGLFDRPATIESLKVLWQGEAITGLTEPLRGLSEAQRNLPLQRLEDAKLLTVNRNPGSGVLISLDAHPLLREYFAGRLRQAQPDAWRAAHRRLYEHLCATTKEGNQPTLEEIQPLYQAVAHGCQAGLQQDACDKVYYYRILRGKELYSSNKLGASGSELGAHACFFDTPWSCISPALTATAQAWLLNQTALCLRALGRLAEALEPMRAALEMAVKQVDWDNAGAGTTNLSELELTLGAVAGAVEYAKQSATYSDRSGDAFQRIISRTTYASALHQAGRLVEAEALFREAEQMQAEAQPYYPLLYSLPGFFYCDQLLTEAEQEAGKIEGRRKKEELLAVCLAVSKRASQTFNWTAHDQTSTLLDIALNHLTLGRAAFYRAILEHADFRLPNSEFSLIDQAVAGLRRAGAQHHLPRGLLTRAWLRNLTDLRTGPESAQSDLNEAWEIAERGPMPLFLADILLYRARLFFCEPAYPWPDSNAKADLAEARRLIEKHGYLRRKEELEDAEAIIRLRSL